MGGFNASDDTTSRSLKELENRVRLIREKKMNAIKTTKEDVNLEMQKKTERLRKDAGTLFQQLDEIEKSRVDYFDGIQTEIEQLSNISSSAQIEKLKRVHEVHEKLNLFEKEGYKLFLNDHLDLDPANQIGTLNASPAQLESLGKVKKMYEKLNRFYRFYKQLSVFERVDLWYCIGFTLSFGLIFLKLFSLLTGSIFNIYYDINYNFLICLLFIAMGIFMFLDIYFKKGIYIYFITIMLVYKRANKIRDKYLFYEK
jgi:hypothetical protein